MWVQTELKKVSTQRTGGIVRCGEPFVQTGRVKLLLAGAATQFGQLMVGAVKNVEAYVTLLHAFEPLVDILFPQIESRVNAAILMDEKGCQLKHPLAPLTCFNSNLFARVNSKTAEWIIVGKRHYQLHAAFINGIGCNDLPNRVSHLES